MGAMVDAVGGLIALMGMAVFLVGIVKPRWPLFWSNNPTRWKAAFLGFVLIIGGPILSTSFGPTIQSGSTPRPIASAPAAPASTIPRNLEPSMNISVENSVQAVFGGTTNLPDHTQLMLTLSRAESGYVAQTTVNVASGHFVTEPFSNGNALLNPGTYKLEVSMSIAALQPPSVQAVIGQHGERMKGKLVRPSVSGTGSVFFYATQVQLGGALNEALDAAARAQSTEIAPSASAQSKDTFVAVAFGAAPGALLCKDALTVQGVYQLYENHAETAVQDQLTHGQYSALHGAAPMPDAEDYDCVLIPPGTPMRLVALVGTIAAQFETHTADGQFVRAITMRGMWK